MFASMHFEFCRLRVHAQSFALEMERLLARHSLPSALASNKYKFAVAHILIFSNTFPALPFDQKACQFLIPRHSKTQFVGLLLNALQDDGQMRRTTLRARVGRDAK